MVCTCWESNSCPLEKKQVSLTTGPSFELAVFLAFQSFLWNAALSSFIFLSFAWIEYLICSCFSSLVALVVNVLNSVIFVRSLSQPPFNSTTALEEVRLHGVFFPGFSSQLKLLVLHSGIPIRDCFVVQMNKFQGLRNPSDRWVHFGSEPFAGLLFCAEIIFPNIFVNRGSDETHRSGELANFFSTKPLGFVCVGPSLKIKKD